MYDTLSREQPLAINPTSVVLAPKGTGAKRLQNLGLLAGLSIQFQFAVPVGRTASFGQVEPRALACFLPATSQSIYPASLDNINLYQARFVIRVDIW